MSVWDNALVAKKKEKRRKKNIKPHIRGCLDKQKLGKSKKNLGEGGLKRWLKSKDLTGFSS